MSHVLFTKIHILESYQHLCWCVIYFVPSEPCPTSQALSVFYLLMFKRCNLFKLTTVSHDAGGLPLKAAKAYKQSTF